MKGQGASHLVGEYRWKDQNKDTTQSHVMQFGDRMNEVLTSTQRSFQRTTV